MQRYRAGRIYTEWDGEMQTGQRDTELDARCRDKQRERELGRKTYRYTSVLRGTKQKQGAQWRDTELNEKKFSLAGTEIQFRERNRLRQNEKRVRQGGMGPDGSRHIRRNSAKCRDQKQERESLKPGSNDAH